MSLKPSPATALERLRAEHPDLPEMARTVIVGRHIHLDLLATDFDSIRAYAEALGGSIRPLRQFMFGDTKLRTHELATTWQGVPVRVSIDVPLAESGAWYRECQLAEQRHQVCDLDADSACTVVPE
jgi:hypothetical protein